MTLIDRTLLSRCPPVHMAITEGKNLARVRQHSPSAATPFSNIIGIPPEVLQAKQKLNPFGPIRRSPSELQSRERTRPRILVIGTIFRFLALLVQPPNPKPSGWKVQATRANFPLCIATCIALGKLFATIVPCGAFIRCTGTPHLSLTALPSATTN